MVGNLVASLVFNKLDEILGWYNNFAPNPNMTHFTVAEQAVHRGTADLQRLCSFRNSKYIRNVR